MGLLDSTRASRSLGEIRQESLVVTTEILKSFDTISTAVTALIKSANYHEPDKAYIN